MLYEVLEDVYKQIERKWRLFAVLFTYHMKERLCTVNVQDLSDLQNPSAYILVHKLTGQNIES